MVLWKRSRLDIMVKVKTFFIILVWFVFSMNIAGSTESFVIKNYHGYFRVLSPKVFNPRVNFIIENKTFTRMYGMIQNRTKKSVDHVSIEPNGFKTIPLELQKDDVVVFVPLSPPFQEVNLIFGKKMYEIPPQR